MTFEEKLALAKEFNKVVRVSESEIISLKADLKSTKEAAEMVKTDVTLIKPK